jgi:hypothetical protein
LIAAARFVVIVHWRRHVCRTAHLEHYPRFLRSVEPKINGGGMQQARLPRGGRRGPVLRVRAAERRIWSEAGRGLAGDGHVESGEPAP